MTLAARTPKSAGASSRVSTRVLTNSNSLFPPNETAAHAKPRTARPLIPLGPARSSGSLAGCGSEITMRRYRVTRPHREPKRGLDQPWMESSAAGGVPPPGPVGAAIARADADGSSPVLGNDLTPVVGGGIGEFAIGRCPSTAANRPARAHGRAISSACTPRRGHRAGTAQEIVGAARQAGSSHTSGGSTTRSRSAASTSGRAGGGPAVPTPAVAAAVLAVEDQLPARGWSATSAPRGDERPERRRRRADARGQSASGRRGPAR